MRVSPASTAVLCPTVIDMSKAGASGVSGCEAGIQSCGSAPGAGGFWNIGDDEAAIPLEKVKWHPERRAMFINMTEEQLEKLRTYDSHWMQLAATRA